MAHELTNYEAHVDYDSMTGHSTCFYGIRAGVVPVSECMHISLHHGGSVITIIEKRSGKVAGRVNGYELFDV